MYSADRIARKSQPMFGLDAMQVDVEHLDAKQALLMARQAQIVCPHGNSRVQATLLFALLPEIGQAKAVQICVESSFDGECQTNFFRRHGVCTHEGRTMHSITNRIGWGSASGLWVIDSNHNGSVRALVLGTSMEMIALLLDNWGARPAFSLLDPLDNTRAKWIGPVLMLENETIPTDAKVGTISLKGGDVYLKCIDWSGYIADVKLPPDEWAFDEDDNDTDYGFGWSVGLHYCANHMAIILPAGAQRFNPNELIRTSPGRH